MKEIQRGGGLATYKCEKCGHREVVDYVTTPVCSQCGKSVEKKKKNLFTPKTTKKSVGRR